MQKWNEIPRIINGLGICIVSTSKGLMTDKHARKGECRRRITLLRILNLFG